MVGTGQIRDLVLATSVLELFSDVPEDEIDIRSFWSHSMACAVLARTLAEDRGVDNVERYFLAGILRALGRLILLLRVPERMRTALDEARSRRIPLHDAEREVFGFAHARVGEALAEAWNLPGSFREAMAYQHNPRAAGQYPDEASAVHLAVSFATALGWGSDGDPYVQAVDPAAAARLEVVPDRLPVIVERARPQHETAVEVISGVLR
jgi:HD-like signal output (HDOD) protein